MKNIVTCCIYLVVTLACNLFAAGSISSTDDFPPVIVELFFESGCRDCLRVHQEILPQATERFKNHYVLYKYDIKEHTNALKLIQYQTKLGTTFQEPVTIVIDYKYVLNGIENIRTGLISCIDQQINERLLPNWKPPVPIITENKEAMKTAEERLNRFNLLAVVCFGLIDGLNPCAISTLVFLITFIHVLRVKNLMLILVGACFVIASFITYTAIGLGILRGLYILDVYPRVRTVLDFSLGCLLLLLAYLSFRDAYRYKKTGDSNAVVVKLPQSVKLIINRIIHNLLSPGVLIAGSLLCGVLVTILEGICTGQTYIPTLVAVIKGGHEIGQSHVSRVAWIYLLVYNTMFVVPLIIAFVLSYAGVKADKFLKWSRTNVIISKVLMGFLFIILSIWMFSLAGGWSLRIHFPG
jgi:hypothetical protein